MSRTHALNSRQKFRSTAFRGKLKDMTRGAAATENHAERTEPLGMQEVTHMRSGKFAGLET